MPIFVQESILPASAQEVYRYHMSPGAFHRLTPPWEPVSVKEQDTGITPGCLRHLRLGPEPLAVNWVARHEDFVPGEQFVDCQEKGPFASWRHTHSFTDTDEGCLLSDHIAYSWPFKLPLGPLLNGKLESTFRYRHRQTRRDLERIARYPRKGAPMKVGVTGASGLVGSALCSFLGVAGHRAVPLERGHEASEHGVLWWPEPDLDGLDGLDAVVHLAGEPIAQLWTSSVRERLYFSRVEGTRRLCRALADLKNPPRTLICASAIGYYDTSQEGPVDENGAPGSDFLARTCLDWEAATELASEAGIRVCNLRVGLVLSSAGGLLGMQLPAFRLGGGAVLGDGQQMQSVVDRDDLVGAIYHLLNREDLEGPFNGTAPEPLTQEEFARTLARALRRPLFLRVPETPARWVLREQANMLFEGVEAVPKRLLDSGFVFHARNFEESLKHQLALP